MTSKNIAIIGASGYTGAELIRIALEHPYFEIKQLIANSNAGKDIGEIYPGFRSYNLPTLVSIDSFDPKSVDLVFCALPHTTSQKVIKEIFELTKIVDLSADFRLRNIADYKKWYGHEHFAPKIQTKATYGLTEFYRKQIRSASLVACTGCNAASGLYPLLPLIKHKVIDLNEIILDLKVGVSGAGRVAKQGIIFPEISEGSQPYSPVSHRHLSEFDQELNQVSDELVSISFTPHLVPMNRGILTTIYAKGSPEEVYNALHNAYHNEPFINVLPMETIVSTRHVRGSNLVKISVFPDRKNNRVKIFSALDNLTKGSSGQAIQNANLMLGFDETIGLNLIPLFP